ncbi:hypothetical protein NK6_9428 [Bradyrhizobium diazoefficiens]|nr:hypothetical protein NK6_9428 [Bradyrhizobium diazoefficiens]
MHTHPPCQFSDVQKPGPGNRPPGENDLGSEKRPFKRSFKNFCHSGRLTANRGLERRIWLDQLIGKRSSIHRPRSGADCGLRRQRM